MLKKFFLSVFIAVSFFILNLHSVCLAKGIDNVQPGNAYLAENSVLSFKLLNELDSDTTKKHDTVQFAVLKDITVKNTVIIPKNTVLTAVVTKAHGSRLFGESGIIRLRINDYKLNDTQSLHFKDELKFKGGRNYSGIAASAIVPFSGLLLKGKEVKLPCGTVIEYKLEDNLDLGIKETDLLAVCNK